jgi:hypothetical protein
MAGKIGAPYGNKNAAGRRGGKVGGAVAGVAVASAVGKVAYDKNKESKASAERIKSQPATRQDTPDASEPTTTSRRMASQPKLRQDTPDASKPTSYRRKDTPDEYMPTSKRATGAPPSPSPKEPARPGRQTKGIMAPRGGKTVRR